MKKLFVRGLLLSPLLAGMIGVNVAADPGNLFSRVERQIAADLLRGSNIANFPNLDDRYLQKLLVEGRTSPVEVLVVGSSRSMEVRSDYFPGRTFHNASVGSARIPDYVAIYEATRARGHKPSLLVIGVDPWVLNARFTDQRWRSLQKEYDRSAVRWGLTPSPGKVRTKTVKKWTQLLSPRYFQDSYRSLVRNDRRPAATTETSGETQFLLKDGSLVCPLAARRQTVEEVRAVARRLLNGPGGGALLNFKELDPAHSADLEKFVKGVRADGVDVLLFLAPWHPAVYEQITRTPEYRMIPAAEDLVRSLATRLGVPLIGSYDPAAAGCGDGDFRDGMHVTDDAARPIFLKLRPGGGR